MQETGKVLLVYPPSNMQSHHSCPLGLLLLAAVLEKEGYHVQVVDANAARNRLTVEDIVRISQEFNPHVIGMTLLTPLIRESYRLVLRLKTDEVKLLAGGPHASILPEEVLMYGFDAVVIGEGEAAISEAVAALLGLMPMDDVLGWAYRKCDGEVIFTEPRELIRNLDDLPFPARHLVTSTEYSVSGNPDVYMNIFSSRGCPAKCAFCSGGLFGKHYRFRSAGSIIEEMNHVNRLYGTTNFHFVDDAMTIDKGRVSQICSMLDETNRSYSFSLMTRIDTINDEILRMLSDSGCIRIDYGVESGFPETLKRIHKPHTVDMVKQIVPLTAETGIKTNVFFILGFPWEDVEATQETFDLMQYLAPYVEYFHQAIASVLIPFPGTELYETFKDEFGFTNWWVSDEEKYRFFDVKSKSFFESEIFWAGNVLRADFFKYPEEIRQKIIDIFKFMYLFNLDRKKLVIRATFKPLIYSAEGAYKVSPNFESWLFSPINAIMKQFKGMKSFE